MNPNKVWQVDSSGSWWEQKAWIPVRDLLSNGINWHVIPEVGAKEPPEPVPWGSVKRVPTVKADEMRFLNLWADLVFSP